MCVYDYLSIYNEYSAKLQKQYLAEEMLAYFCDSLVQRQKSN